MGTHNICFEQNYENSKKKMLKIVIFIVVKYRCILHGRVFVMLHRHYRIVVLQLRLFFGCKKDSISVEKKG